MNLDKVTYPSTLNESNERRPPCTATNESGPPPRRVARRALLLIVACAVLAMGARRPEGDGERTARQIAWTDANAVAFSFDISPTVSAH